jgi:hypothetical protein
MKKLIIISAFLLVGLVAKSQDVRFSVNGNSILNKTFSAYSINPSLDVGVGEHFNLHYSLGFGVRGNKKFYMHLPGLAPVGMIAFVAGLDDYTNFMTYLGILLILLPEGVSYDIPLNDNWELTPFININSAECFTSGVNNDFNYHLSADGGVAARYYFSDKFFGQVYSSAKIIESKAWGVSGGFGFGLAW